ncbi:hypothetical protein OE88DRAFT_1738891 [Heliocybe sulcata]|uniref:Integral membrane protein n=1 Tax=Heliocybe sulcata TaxID=5364 RepID=A0A5C3N0C7_9AGAM|nr:hypothetical protein OE88DRAFT_1738891 [Heliocybe sulcata]
MHVEDPTEISKTSCIAAYYLMAVTFYTIIWSARLAILFSIIRLDPNPVSYKLKWVAGGWVRNPEPGWKDARSPQYGLNKEVASDVISDLLLIILPIRLIRGIRAGSCSCAPPARRSIIHVLSDHGDRLAAPLGHLRRSRARRLIRRWNDGGPRFKMTLFGFNKSRFSTPIGMSGERHSGKTTTGFAYGGSTTGEDSRVPARERSPATPYMKDEYCTPMKTAGYDEDADGQVVSLASMIFAASDERQREAPEGVKVSAETEGFVDSSS